MITLPQLSELHRRARKARADYDEITHRYLEDEDNAALAAAKVAAFDELYDAEAAFRNASRLFVKAVA
jgi:hypothetical protein